jgi:hypothetical protein
MTGEPQTARPSGRFLFRKDGYQILTIDASEAREVQSDHFILDVAIRRDSE